MSIGSEEKVNAPLFRIIEMDHPFNQGAKRKIAYADAGGVHLSIAPNDLLYPQSGYEVYVFADDGKGNPDTSKVLNSTIVDGTLEDLPEMADTYSSRLAHGVKPEDLFRDIEEADMEFMREYLRGLKEKKK